MSLVKVNSSDAERSIIGKESKYITEPSKGDYATAASTD